MEIVKKYWLILLIGVLIRLIIASFTFHPDVRNNSIVSTIILREGNLNPYDFVSGLNANDPRKKIYSNETADDLPLVYWINIPIQLILRPFVDGNIEYQYLSKIENIFSNPSLFVYLLIIKMQFILFDIFLGILLTSLVADALKKKVLFFWIFNPMTIWATAAIGQFDIIPTFFMVLSLFFLQRKSPNLSALSLGLSAAIKSFGFLIFPFLLFTSDGWKERIRITVIFLFPWIFSIIPYLFSPGFRHNALFAPQLSKILYAKISLSGGESVSVVLIILIFLYLLYTTQKRTTDDFMRFSLAALLLVLSFTHFHIQWFLWVTPFILIIFDKLNNPLKLSVGFLGLSVFFMLFLFEASLQVRLFAPLFPALNNSRGLVEALGPDRSTAFRDFAATLFASSSIFLTSYLVFPKKTS